MPIATVALMRHGGSHLIRPIVAELGFDIIEPGNFGAPIGEARGKVIVWLRDPRDRMVSTMRWWRNKPRKLNALTAAGDSDDEQLAWLLGEGGFLPEMLRWSRIWCARPLGTENALAVRFEDMRQWPIVEIDAIARHLGVACDAVAIRDLTLERGRTFTGRYSDWRQSFGPLATAVWSAQGGAELLEIMGYA